MTQSCGKVDKVDKISMNWSNFDLDLPDGLEVYVGLNDEIPLKAWVAKIDLSKENVFVKVLSSNDKDQLSTPMQFLKETGAKCERIKPVGSKSKRTPSKIPGRGEYLVRLPVPLTFPKMSRGRKN